MVICKIPTTSNMLPIYCVEQTGVRKKKKKGGDGLLRLTLKGMNPHRISVAEINMFTAWYKKLFWSLELTVTFATTSLANDNVSCLCLA